MLKREIVRKDCATTGELSLALVLLYSTLVWRRVAFPPEAFCEAIGEPESARMREEKGREEEIKNKSRR